MRNKMRKATCLMLAVLCMAGISVTAYASGGDEAVAPPSDETVVETENPVSDEPGESVEIPFSYTIDGDGNLVITIDGVSETVKITATGTVVTGGSCLNVRTGAGLDYEIIDQLRPGEEVTVIGSEGEWYEVIVPEKKGYVHSDYLKIAENNGQNIEIDADMLKQFMELLGSGSTGGEDGEDGKSPLALTPDGNLTLIDDFLQAEAPATQDSEQLEKQFITLQSKNGNTFYLVIDRNGKTENVYFMNLVDEADLMALMEDGSGGTSAPTCSCTDKCVVGAINTNCEICGTNMSECTGKEADPEPEPTEPAEEPNEEKKSANFLPLIILLLAGAAGGAAYWFKFRKPKTKTSGDSDLDDYDFGEEDDDEDEETELDDSDVMAEAESEDEDA